MSNTNHNDRALDEQLDRHVAALRDEATDSGPSNETVSATLALLERKHQLASGRRNYFERLARMSFAQRIAAVVMITLGALTLYAVFGIFNSLGTSVAFADVAQKLKSARTLQFNSTVTLPGQPPRTMKMLIEDPDKMRTEMDGRTLINANHVLVVIDSKNKTVNRIELKGEVPQKNSEHNVVGALRSLGDMKGEPIGEKKIDGIDAKGFHTTAGERKMTIWADKDARPVRVEMTMNIGQGEANIVMDHFIIDAPLDDTLFSQDVPPDYKIATQTMEMPKLGKIEDEIAALLKTYTDASGGTFPPSLSDWTAFIKLKAVPDQALIARLGAVSGQLFTLENGYGYAGKDVKLGEKDKIIFWYKPAKSETYRAVFGDLHTGDVTKEQLPATQPSVK